MMRLDKKQNTVSSSPRPYIHDGKRMMKRFEKIKSKLVRNKHENLGKWKFVEQKVCFQSYQLAS
jgi:hypothetical protein